MPSRVLVFSTAAIFLVAQLAPAAAQAAHKGGHHSTGTHEHHWHPSHQDHQPRDHHKALHERPNLSELHNLYTRIDSAAGLSDSDRQMLHESIDAAASNTSEISEATAALESLRAEAAGSLSESRKTEIEQERAALIARISAGQAGLQTLKDRVQGEIQDRIAAAPELTEAEKQKLRELLDLVKENKVTLAQTEATLQGVGVFFLVLFIMLVIIGTG